EAGETTRVALSDPRPQDGDGLRELVDPPLRVRQRCRGIRPFLRCAEERAVSLEEPDRSLVLPESLELLLELLVESECPPCRLHLVGGGARRGLHRCRSGLRHENERKQANEEGSQTVYLLDGDRGAVRTGTARVARSEDPTRASRPRAGLPYKWLRKPVTSVTARDSWKRGGLRSTMRRRLARTAGRRLSQRVLAD